MIHSEMIPAGKSHQARSSNRATQAARQLSACDGPHVPGVRAPVPGWRAGYGPDSDDLHIPAAQVAHVCELAALVKMGLFPSTCC
jgi:hypothetical protein